MIHQHMIYHGFVLGSSEFKSSATLVKVRILKFVFFISNICLFQFGRVVGCGGSENIKRKKLTRLIIRSTARSLIVTFLREK